MWILAALLLSLLIAGYVVLPNFIEIERAAIDTSSNHPQALLDKKERSLRALKDLELDFAMGKISTEDYQVAKSSLANEASGILQELKRHGTS